MRRVFVEVTEESQPIPDGLHYRLTRQFVT
jgi:hypothetical protein